MGDALSLVKPTRPYSFPLRRQRGVLAAHIHTYIYIYTSQPTSCFLPPLLPSSLLPFLPSSLPPFLPPSLPALLTLCSGVGCPLAEDQERFMGRLEESQRRGQGGGVEGKAGRLREGGRGGGTGG